MYLHYKINFIEPKYVELHLTVIADLSSVLELCFIPNCLNKPENPALGQ